MSVCGNWLYYQGDIDDTIYKLYRISLDGQIKELVTEDDVHNFIIYGEWIYCIIFEDSEDKEFGGKIYKMRLDGSFKSRLSDKRALYFNVSDGNIVFNNEKVYQGFYLMDINGHNLVKINDDAFDIRVIGNELFYTCFSEGSILVKFNLDNNQKTILEDGQVELIDIHNGSIFYILKNPEFYDDGSVNENDILIGMKPDGSEKTELFKGNIGDVYIHNNDIFIVDLTNTIKHQIFGGNILKMPIDGSSIMNINHSKSGNLNFDGEWIVYEKRASFVNRKIFRGICKVRTDGTGYRSLTKGCCNIYDVKDGWVYYKILVKQLNTNLFEVQLRKIRIDGSNDSYLLTFEVHDYRIIKSGYL